MQSETRCGNGKQSNPRCSKKCVCTAACGIFARLLLAPGSPDLALAFFRRAPPPPHAAAVAGLPNGGAPQDLSGFQAPGGGGRDAALLAFVDLWLDRRALCAPLCIRYFLRPDQVRAHEM